MDLAPGVDAPVYARGAAFPRLELPEVKAIAYKLKADQLQTVDRLVQVCRLTPWERFRALQEVETVGVRITDLVRYACTPDGADAVLDASMVKGGDSDGSKAAARKALAPVEMAALAVDLVSAADDQRPENADGRPKPPNPSAASTPNP